MEHDHEINGGHFYGIFNMVQQLNLVSNVKPQGGEDYNCIYTVQPIITLDAHLFEASNMVVTYSSSEKLTTSLIEYWCDQILVPSLGQRKKFLLISDCWRGQTDEKGLYDHISGCKRLELSIKTTAQMQPLDLFQQANGSNSSSSTSSITVRCWMNLILTLSRANFGWPIAGDSDNAVR